MKLLKRLREYRDAYRGGKAMADRTFDDPGVVRAPWDSVFVAWLNDGQRDDHTHSYTCPNGHELAAFEDGWSCTGCLYTQDWAHAPRVWGQG